MQAKIKRIDEEDKDVSQDFTGTIFVSFSKPAHVLTVIQK